MGNARQLPFLLISTRLSKNWTICSLAASRYSSKVGRLLGKILPKGFLTGVLTEEAPCAIVAKMICLLDPVFIDSF